MSDLLYVLVLAAPLVGIWLLLIRPAQRRAQEAAVLAASLEVGQQVVTTSGLFGQVTALGETTVDLQVAPGVELRFDRRAVGRVVPESGEGDAGA